MMEPVHPDLPRPLAEGMARTLRHEIGDFLQKVYASVALLQSKLPAEWQLERDILARLRKHAEGCKNLLDAVQDFFGPVSLMPQPLDLAETAADLVRTAQEQCPQLQLTAETMAAAPITGDPDRIAQVGRFLLANACESARKQVRFQTRVDAATQIAEWTVTDDGPGIPEEMVGYLFNPFFTTRAGHAGLGLALARKLARLHGGEVTAGNLSAGGFQARVTLPIR